MKKLVVLMFITWGIISLIVPSSFAADWKAYTEIGGMNVTEQGISEGHKSYFLIGAETSIENRRAKALVGIEGFVRGEPADEDPEIPSLGGGIFAEYSVKPFDWMHPYLGVRYDHFSRDVAPKYIDNPAYEQETEHDIVSASGGLHFQKGIFYADIGTVIPFYTNTKSGNFGPDVGVGVKWKRIGVGYHYKEYRFTDNHLSGDEAFSFYFSGVKLTWDF